jgi:hypothetical protein
MEIATPPTSDLSPAVQRRSTRVKAREYSGPLGILAAGAIGISLLCSVSAMAMGDLNRYIPMTLVPINLVDLAVSNFGTAAALTEQIVTVFVPTETLMPSNTPVPESVTPQSTDTLQRFVTITPTITRRVRATLTAVVVASRTPTRPPTRTPPPTSTRTLRPTPTFAPTLTPVPPTDTEEPPTITHEPPTTTQEPPTPTDEPPTATEPPVTDVPTAVDPGSAPPTETPGP